MAPKRNRQKQPSLDGVHFREMTFVFEAERPWHPDQLKYTVECKKKNKKRKKKRRKPIPTKVFYGSFTDTTINMVNHLGYRLDAIGTDSFIRIMASLWEYDGEQKETANDVPLPAPGDAIGSSTNARAATAAAAALEEATEGGFNIMAACARPHHDIFEASLAAASKSLKDGNIPRAFNIAMAVTANFKEERITGPWLDGAEDLDECSLLLNRLLKIWKKLLPLTDEELRIGSGQTRTVIAESVRELCSIFTKRTSPDAPRGKGLKVKMLDCESYLALAEDSHSEYLVNRLLAVNYDTTGSGLLFHVRWGHPYDDPLHDEWLPLENLTEVEALGKFLMTKAYASFSSTAEFGDFSARHPDRVPRWPPPSVADDDDDGNTLAANPVNEAALATTA